MFFSVNCALSPSAQQSELVVLRSEALCVKWFLEHLKELNMHRLDLSVEKKIFKAERLNLKLDCIFVLKK